MLLIIQYIIFWWIMLSFEIKEIFFKVRKEAPGIVKICSHAKVIQKLQILTYCVVLKMLAVSCSVQYKVRT